MTVAASASVVVESTGWAVELSGRGSYVARLAGTDPVYGFVREWADRVRSWHGRRGYFAVVDRPGFYEVKTRPYGTPAPRRYYASWDGTSWERIPASLYRWVPLAVDGPAPDEPGSWFADRCHCGAPVDRYTPAGFPRCDDHYDPTEHAEHSRELEPDPGPDDEPF